MSTTIFSRGTTGENFGKLSVLLKTSGRGSDFRIQDVWMAAQCVQHNLILLTINRKDFADIPGVQLTTLVARRKKIG